MEKIHVHIEDDIADTLFITLYAKSEASKQKSPLITDDIACDLVDRIDYDFSKYKNKSASIIGVAIRSAHFDQMIKTFIAAHERPVIVLPGCGLDSRVHRLGKVAEKATFYELDLLEVTNLRKRLMPPLAHEEYMAASILTTDWMDNILVKHPHGDFMFVIEGVLMYFSEKENRLVFSELAKRFKGAEIHFDMLNKWMSTKSSIHDTVRKTKATFKFGIDDDREIEKWHPNLRFIRSYLFNDFRGGRRMGLVLWLLMHVIPVFKKSSRLLMYKIGE
ncbi:class I SAM-dependent methyltransferase [Olivibacter ginsenosidimutans]|uniref:Class I SAM-dependent methyltransferase n=1 Tax=Olivibacter ginsenosidimutans TaxID=1176537 RepID=A0ABP9BU12_9SPHI